MNKLEIIPIVIKHNFSRNDDIGFIIEQAIKENNQKLLDNDILIVTHKIVSKSEGRVLLLKDVMPSERAISISRLQAKDPRLMEIILKESRKIIKMNEHVRVCETTHGFICANAGVDQSNIEEDSVVLLPLKPDVSAQKVRKYFLKHQKNIAVIISDTFGRPFREGQINVAIGIAGIDPFKNYIGTQDMFGKILRSTNIAICDEMASAGELVMGKSDNIPVVIIRGYPYICNRNSNISSIIRKEDKDIFR